jgi:uncharacterized membrane protein
VPGQLRVDREQSAAVRDPARGARHTASPPTPVTATAGNDGSPRRWAARFLACAASLWLAAIVVTPLARANADGPAARAAAAVFHLACGRLCHQQPARSFHSHGEPWPVCARCTGLYAGAAVGAWCAVLWRRAGRKPQGAHRAEGFRWPLLAAAAPTAATWAVEFAGIAAFSNLARFVLALPLGVVAAGLITGMAAGRVE